MNRSPFNNFKSFQSGKKKKNIYRTTNIAITTPTIINTHVPNIPPTSIGRLFDDDSNGILFKISRKNVDNSYDFLFGKRVSFRI